MEDDRVYKTYIKEINKDLTDIDKAKKVYAKEVKESIGREINDINSYIKKEPSFFSKVKSFISKVFRHL